VSNSGTSSFQALLRRLSWKLALPLLMAALTIGLHYLDRAWLRAWGAWDDLAVTTARGLSVLLNGPGSFFAPGLKLSGQLLGVAIFWTWIGFLLDRRLRGIKTSTIRRIWLRVALHVVGLGVSCWLIWNVARFIEPATVRDLFKLPSIFLSNSPVRFLRGRDFVAIAEILWGLGYAIYFLKKLWLLRKARPTAT